MKRRISTQLSIGLVAAMVMVTAMAGATWWVVSEAEEATLEDQRHAKASTALVEAQSALWQLRQAFPEYMVADGDTRRRILEEEGKWDAIVETSLDVYAQAAQSPIESEALANLRSHFLRFKESRPKFFELYAAGRTEDALAWRALTTAPYAEATVRAFARLTKLHRAQAAEKALQESAWLHRIHIAVVALGGLVLGLLALGYWAARRALRPIQELRERAERVVREQLGETIDVTPDANEVEGLVKSFERMTDAFSTRAEALVKADEALKRHRSELEHAVVARTLELESANRMLATRDRHSRLVTELTGVLQTVRDLDEALRVLPRTLESLFSPHAGALYIAKPSLDQLNDVAHWGADDLTASFEFSDCWALRRGETYSVESSGLVCPHGMQHPTAHTYLCAPMVSQGTIFGLLHVAYASAPANDTAARERLEHARYVTEQLSLALANLRLREALREQAMRDVVTGLFNRRHLEESLERELARARREDQPLTLLMLDVDYFKRFNDQHGHEAGDAVLRSLGRLLLECTRAGDIACRFGGEEFAVALPKANLEQARIWALRLVERVHTMVVRSGGQTLPRVTVSIGVAGLNGADTDAEQLIKAADLALYEAKRTGRDRVMVAGEASSVAA